jgi:hypothetical protein
MSGRRPPFRRPTVLIGADATALGQLTITPAQAAAVGMYGVDLDLRRAWLPPAEDELDRLATTRVRSVWLPSHYAGPFAELRAARLRGFLTRAAARSGLRTIVLPTVGTGGARNVSIGRIARQLADLQPVRIAIAIDAGETLKRPGSHLAHVANVRRVAEEWDLDIALDLSVGETDHWEAEAALMRLFPRLALVRLLPFHVASGAHAQTPVAAMSLRSVAMLADQAYAGLVSITPGPRAPAWLSWLSRPNASLAGAARQEILDTYDRVDHYDVRAHETNPRPW